MTNKNIFTYVEKGAYAPREDLDFVERENVALIIFYSGKYLFLSWNEVDYKYSLVTGGIDASESKEDAVKREIEEETGYYDIESIVPVNGVNISEFFVEHKNENRRAFYYPYFVKLRSLDKNEVLDSEKKEHTCLWFEKAELDSIDMFDNHRYMLDKVINK